MLTITENVKFYRNANEELEWMAKSQAGRSLARAKMGRKDRVQVRRKTKQQRRHDRFMRKMNKCHNHK